jgi:oligogalacturonide transporter
VSGSQTQTSEAVTTILLVLGVGTLGLLAFGFAVSLRFNLNRLTHAVLMAEIERFKHHPDTLPSPQDRQIVEDLSGWPYERLWGRGLVGDAPAARVAGPAAIDRHGATLR